METMVKVQRVDRSMSRELEGSGYSLLEDAIPEIDVIVEEFSHPSNADLILE
jgi:hypothetical protein